jgi:hypothetical protein
MLVSAQSRHEIYDAGLPFVLFFNVSVSAARFSMCSVLRSSHSVRRPVCSGAHPSIMSALELLGLLLDLRCMTLDLHCMPHALVSFD